MHPLLQRIAQTPFFSRMGQPLPAQEGVYAVGSLAAALQAIDNDGFAWMPNALEDPDPFHGPLPRPAALMELRRQVNQALMRTLSAQTHASLRLPPHDFHLAARDAAMYAYRQSLTEEHLGLPPRWQEVVDLYSCGHWPLAHAPGRLLVV